MIVYLIGVLVLLFIGAIRLVNWVRFRNKGFSLIELLVCVSVAAGLLGLWDFSRHVGH